MNNFTLTFQDASLEIDYQKLMQKYHNQLFTWISIFSALSSFLLILNTLIDEDNNYLSVRIASFCFIIFQAALVKYFPRIINFGMIGINLCLLTNQFYYFDIDPIHIYIRGENQMGITAIILLCTDLKLGILNNLFLLIIRVFLVQYYAISSNVIDIIYMILVQTCLLICLYYKNLYQRRFYLATMKDNQYGNNLFSIYFLEQMIPQIISKPFFLFRFDKNSLQFVAIRTELKHFLPNVESPLKYFLRTAKYQKISLESYLFRRTNEREWRKQVDSSLETLQITFEKQIKVITVSQLALEVQTFIMIVDDEDCNSQLVKQSYQKRLTNQYIIQRRFVQQQINLLKNVNKKLKLSSLAKLHCQYAQILCVFDIEKNCIVSINFTKLIKSLIHVVQNKKSKINFKSNKETIQIRTIKSYFIIYMIEVFKRAKFMEGSTLIELFEFENQVTLKIYTKIVFNNSQLLNKINLMLLESTKHEVNEHTFKFYPEPMIQYEIEN